MSVRGVIDQFFDLPALKKQKEDAAALVQQYIDSIKGIPSIRAQVADTSNLKQSVAAMNELAGANAKTAESTVKVVAATKQLSQAQALTNAQTAETNNQLKVRAQLENAVAGSLEESKLKVKQLEYQLSILNTTTEKGAAKKRELIAAIAEEKTEQINLAEAQKQANKAIVDQAQAMLAASNATKTGGETVELLRTKLKSLTQDRDTKINILDPVALDKANQQIAVVKKQLDSIEQAGGNFKGNVGNYTNSINVLKGSLDKATASMQKMTEAGTQNNAEGQALAHEISLLTALVGQQANGFLSLTRETSNTAKAVETIHEQLQVLKADGLQNSEAFQQLEATFLTLNQEFTDSKRKLNEFRLEQKILTDQTPKIAALTAAARGLGGIYATAAGGAQLLAPENEHLAEKLNQLVAVMTLLQGLEEFHRLLTERNAIATALFGSTTAATTVAVEGEAAAMEAAAVTGGTFNRILSFIAANPIVLFLTGLAAVTIYLVSTFESEEKQLKKVAKASKDYSDDVKDLSESLSTQNSILTKGLKDQKTKLENDLAAAKASGINAQTELAYKQKILNLDKQIADQDMSTRPEIDKDIQSQTESLAVLNAKKEQQLDVTNKLLKLQDEGVKKVLAGTTTAVEEKIQTLTEKSAAFASGAIKAQGGNATAITEQDIKDAIKASRKLQDINTEAIASAKSAVEGLQKVKDDKIKADAAALENENTISKLSADDRRKVALATAQIEVSAVQDKNAIILSDERSTFDERIAAMKSNQDQEKKLADAELKNIEGDNTKSDAEVLIARDEHFAKIKKIEADGAEEIRKETLADHIRRLSAEQDFNKSIIQADADRNDLIAKDDTRSVDDRTAAYGKYVEDQRKLVLDDADFQKATKVLTAEEITALDEATAEKLKQIAVKSAQDLNDILVSSLREQEALKQSFANAELAKKEAGNVHGKAGDQLKDALRVNEQLEYDSNRRKLTDAQAIDDEIRNNILTSDAEKEKALIDFNNKQAELYKLDEVRYKQVQDEKKADFIDSIEKVVQVTEVVFNTVAGLARASADKEKNRLQGQIDLLDQQKAKEIEVADQTITNAQVKADTIAVIEAKAADRKAALELKQRQADERAARFEKAANIASIILNTAVAVTKFLSKGDTVEAVIAGIIGAAQLAIAIATPIPKFKHGGVTKGGIVEVGDGGKSEGVTLPDGTVLRTPAHSTFVDLPAGSVIHPDFDKMMLSASLKAVPDARVSVPYEKTTKAVERMERAVVKAINNKQENHWHMPGRYDTAMRDGSGFHRYLKGNL